MVLLLRQGVGVPTEACIGCSATTGQPVGPPHTPKRWPSFLSTWRCPAGVAPPSPASWLQWRCSPNNQTGEEGGAAQSDNQFKEQRTLCKHSAKTDAVNLTSGSTVQVLCFPPPHGCHSPRRRSLCTRCSLLPAVPCHPCRLLHASHASATLPRAAYLLMASSGSTLNGSSI